MFFVYRWQLLFLRRSKNQIFGLREVFRRWRVRKTFSGWGRGGKYSIPYDEIMLEKKKKNCDIRTNKHQRNIERFNMYYSGKGAIPTKYYSSDIRTVLIYRFEFKRQLDWRGHHVPSVRVHHGTMGLVVRVLRHGAARHGVVRGLVAVRVRHARPTPVHHRKGTGAHHQQPHRRGVVRKGERRDISLSEEIFFLF